MNRSKSASIKRVYVLSGASRSGKTSSLNVLAKIFDNDKTRFSRYGAWVLKTGFHDGKYVFVELASGRRIGIVTAGDGAQQIIEGLSFLVSNQCDICFIASKTSGVSVREIENQYVKTLHIIPQYRFLINEHSVRGPSIVWNDVARQLFCEI